MRGPFVEGIKKKKTVFKKHLESRVEWLNLINLLNQIDCNIIHDRVYSREDRYCFQYLIKKLWKKKNVLDIDHQKLVVELWQFPEDLTNFKSSNDNSLKEGCHNPDPWKLQVDWHFS